MLLDISERKAAAGHTIKKFESAFPKLIRVDVDQPICGRTVERIESQGNAFFPRVVLLTHMLMSGSWHIYRLGERWRLPRSAMRGTLGTDDFEAVAFNIQIAEFHTLHSLSRRGGFARLGPTVLAPTFDVTAALGHFLAIPELEIGRRAAQTIDRVRYRKHL